MQQLMQEFYSKKDKKPRVPRFGSNKKKKRSTEPSLPTFTVEQMMKTVNAEEDITNPDYDFRSIAANKRASKNNQTSGTGGQKNPHRGKKPRKRAKAKKKMDFGGSLQRNTRKTRGSNNLKDPEFLMMRSDVNDYKRRATNNEDITRFERFLHDGEEEEDIEVGYEHETRKKEAFINERPDLSKMQMKDAMKYMTREERDEYLAEKKRIKKEKFEEEQRKINSFKPKINFKSKQMDNNRTRHMKMNRHELLFGLNKVLKHREIQLKEIVEAEKFMKYAQEELNECTFRPKINQGGTGTINEGSIAQRTQAFMERKKRRVEEHKKLNEMNEVKDCTFNPKINYRREYK